MHATSHTWRQEGNLGSQFFPPTIQVPGIDLKTSDVAAHLLLNDLISSGDLSPVAY